MNKIIEQWNQWRAKNPKVQIDLHGADLYGADLRWADLHGADLYGADLRWADLRGADLRGADLRWADLRGADLRRADLREANIDYSCLPMCCGGQDFKGTAQLGQQLLAHAFAIDCDDPEYLALRETARSFCAKSHIAQYIDWLNV